MTKKLLLLVASALLCISGCGGTAEPERVLNRVPDVGMVSVPAYPVPTPQIRVELPETAPEDVEERPIMQIELEITDEQTGQPIAASVHFAIREYGEAEYRDSRRDVCGYVSRCHLKVLATDSLIYKIVVERAGYALWAVEVRVKSLSTRTMTVPVRLVRSDSVNG